MKNPLSRLEREALLRHCKHDIRTPLPYLITSFYKRAISSNDEGAAWGLANSRYVEACLNTLEQVHSPKESVDEPGSLEDALSFAQKNQLQSTNDFLRQGTVEGITFALKYLSAIAALTGKSSEYQHENERILANIGHIGSTLGALVQAGSDDIDLRYATREEVTSEMLSIKSVLNRDDIRIETWNLTGFITQLKLLRLAVYTLSGNSAMKVPHGGGSINITVTDYDGAIDADDIVYRHNVTPIKGEFRRFRIQDTGPGFDYGTSFEEIGVNHFGLKLVDLLSRVLMCHVTNKKKMHETEIGGADISIYHPADIRGELARASFLYPVR